MKTFTIFGQDDIKKGIAVETREMKLFGIPLGQGFHKEFDGIEDRYVGLHNFDVMMDAEKTPERIVKELHPRDRRAVVMVDVLPGAGGDIQLMSDCLGERFDEKTHRVLREILPLERAVGIHYLGDMAEDDGTKFLIGMDPGSRFRIVRTGRIPEGEPSELVVRWHGGWNYKATDPNQSSEAFQEQRRNMKNWRLEVKAASKPEKLRQHAQV